MSRATLVSKEEWESSRQEFLDYLMEKIGEPRVPTGYDHEVLLWMPPLFKGLLPIIIICKDNIRVETNRAWHLYGWNNEHLNHVPLVNKNKIFTRLRCASDQIRIYQREIAELSEEEMDERYEKLLTS